MSTTRLALTRLASDQRGGATVWFLVSVPALLLVLVLSFENTELTHTSEWLQEGLNRSVKAAAWQVTAPSYAVYTPAIDPVRAEDAFRSVLAHNLRLDPETLLSLSSRIKGTPSYTLMVYNGPYPYHYENQEFGVDVTFREPTALALLEVSFGNTLGNTRVTIRRWAKAEVVPIPIQP